MRRWPRMRSITYVTLVAFVAIAATLAATPSADAVNETPKKKNAIIFGPHPSAQDVDEAIERWLCAENYGVTKYVWGRGGDTPTIARLQSIATAGFAVLVIVAHGGTDAITLEDYAHRDSAVAHYNRYRNDPAYANLKNDLEHGAVPEPDPSGGGSGTRYYVGLKTAGLHKLFGGVDNNRSIVCALACKSWEMQTTNTPKPFGATEFLGYSGVLDNKTRSKGARGFAIMGGPDGIPSRPVAPAFAGKMKHDGPGNTTLAPACTDHTPENDVVLPLHVKTDGFTDYETKMNVTNAAIMEASGCEAAITDQAWTNETHHQFKVEPTKKGRLVFKVKPTVAVSQNNDNWLIGNLYLPSDDYQDPRTEINECQFGQSGLDGLRPCVPDENPYRWCVWCQEKPADPPGRPKEPKPVGTSSAAPRQIAPGEQDAFVLYQDAPGETTSFLHSPLPANLFFAQVGSWYGHVVFTPDAGQVGQQFQVLFQTFDENGPRAEQLLTWDVVARINQMALATVEEEELPAGDLGLAIVRPGDPVDHRLVLQNTGSTVIENITLSAVGLPGLATFTPGFVAYLEPGETMATTLHLDGVLVPSGTYAGAVTVQGSNVDGPQTTEATFSVRVNNPPVVEVPSDVLIASVGVPIAVPITYSDPDGDLLAAYLEMAPFDSELQLEGGAMAAERPQASSAMLLWTPPAESAGLVHKFPVVADDGAEPAMSEIAIQVQGATDVESAPARIAFSLGPSPARGAIRFAIETDAPGAVTIEVFDVAGRRVARPFAGVVVDVGARSWTWRPESLERGIYFVHASLGGRREVRRLVWLGGAE